MKWGEGGCKNLCVGVLLKGKRMAETKVKAKEEKTGALGRRNESEME